MRNQDEYNFAFALYFQFMEYLRMGSVVDPNKYYLYYNRHGFGMWIKHTYDTDLPNYETDKMFKIVEKESKTKPTLILLNILIVLIILK